MESPTKINIKFIVILVIISILSYLYFNSKTDVKNSQQLTHAVNVNIINVKSKDVKLNFEYPGIVSGYKEILVKPQIEGIIEKKIYKEGQSVKKNDILFSIDKKPYIALLKKAESSLANCIILAAKAEQSWQRGKTLFENDAISAQEKDEIFSNLKIAKDNVRQAEIDVEIATINLSYTDIVSPIDGVSSIENFSEGNLVTSNDIVTKIIQNDIIHINFAYPENDFYMIEDLIKGNKIIDNLGKVTALIQLNDKIISEHGIIDFTDNKIDQNTSSILARLQVSNKDKSLKSGQFVRIIIDNISIKNSIVIPEQSIIHTSNGAITYIANEDNKIEVRPIKLGFLTNEGYIVESGLNNGDKLIEKGLIKLKPGQKITVSSDGSL